jgi:AcrR family transcriptional regulator
MARPANADPEATRNRLLEAGTHVFGRVGLDGARLREVAARAKVTEATIHHYFDGKTGLFDACLDQAFGEMLALGLKIAEDVAGAGDAERIRAFTRAAFRAARQNPDRTRLLLRAFLFEESEHVGRKTAEAQRALLTAAAGTLGGRPPFGKRLPVLGLGMLITRLSLGSAAEHALIADEMGDADEAMEAYLAAVAEHTLLGGGTP